MSSICVFGARAIGGYVAAKLELSGVHVSVVARGPHSVAMQSDGLVLQSDGKRTTTHPMVVSDCDELGQQDYILLTLKAYSIGSALQQLLPLIGPSTTIVSMANGMPWWYAHQLPEPFTNRRIKSVDPTGEVWMALPPGQCVGSVLYPAAKVVAPGVVHHLSGSRMILGEPDGTRSCRTTHLAGLLAKAQIDAAVSANIRDDLWLKLRASMAVNPISTLTTATLDVVASEDDSLQALRSMMLEGQAVGEALGIKFATNIDQQIRDTIAKVGHHKTSMLQVLNRVDRWR